MVAEIALAPVDFCDGYGIIRIPVVEAQNRQRRLSLHRWFQPPTVYVDLPGFHPHKAPGLSIRPGHEALCEQRVDLVNDIWQQCITTIHDEHHLRPTPAN